MKIWVNIAIVILIISLGAVEIFQIYSLPVIKKEIIRLQGERLKAAAASVALSIDGDKYSSIDFTKDGIANSAYFRKLRGDLLSIKNILSFEDEIYSLNFIDDSTAVFGVTTNDSLYTGNLYKVKNRAARKIYNRILEAGQCAFIGVYKDQNGTWISGIAPIIDSRNRVVGVIQTDHKATIINKALDTIKERILIFKVILFVVVILLSIAFSKIITRPIKNVTEVIKQIANGNYQKTSDIKSSGELKELITSTDLMRRTILEQQTKIFETIHNLKTINKQLTIERDKAKESDTLKAEFLSMISHEIRTPINIMLNYSALIKESIPDDRLAENDFVFKAIKKASWRLIRTVDLIVTTAEFQTGTYKISKSNINLGELLKNIFYECQSFTDEKTLEFIFENNTEDSIIYGDDYSIKQIFANLIDNAIKFTEKGTVAAKLFRDDEKHFVVEISDTGIGISEEYQEKIYSVFSQEEHGYTRKFDGNGLGLALVKKACELNNVQLAFKSEKNVGTTFTLVFSEEKYNQLQTQSEAKELKTRS